MKITFEGNSFAPFGELVAGDSFVFDKKKYTKIDPIKVENRVLNAVHQLEDGTKEGCSFFATTVVDTCAEYKDTYFGELDIGDIFLYDNHVLMRITTKNDVIYNGNAVEAFFTNSIDLSTGKGYKWFDHSQKVKILDYKFTVKRES